MRTVAIGFVVSALAFGNATAQTGAEQAQILRDFQANVADYARRYQGPNALPGSSNATTPPPRIFTLPVATVFRQLIAKRLTWRRGAVVSGGSTYPHPAVLEPFPSIWLQEFPRVLKEALPPLPAPLEYRLIGHDLVVRDTKADLVVGVLRDAVGPALTVER